MTNEEFRLQGFYLQVLTQVKKPTTGALQRALKLKFNEAAAIIDRFEKAGIIRRDWKGSADFDWEAIAKRLLLNDTVQMYEEGTRQVLDRMADMAQTIIKLRNDAAMSREAQ
jgi:hypothetical protein